MAAAAGVTQVTWSNWEKKPPAQFTALVRLAIRYGTTVDYLLGLTDDPGQRRGQTLPKPLRELVAMAIDWPEIRQQELLDVALIMDAADRDADMREYDRMIALLAGIAEGSIAKDAIESALRVDAAGDRAEALRLIDAFFAGRSVRNERYERTQQP